jgi:hypothetical protein
MAALVAAACGGDSKTVKIPGGGEVSSSDKIPDDFPDSFPKYGGAKVKGSVTGENQGISGTSVIWETDDSLDKVQSFFDDKFASGDWKSSSNGEAGGTAYWSGESKDGKQVFYAGATESDGKTTISVVIGDNENPSSNDDSDDSELSSGDETATAVAEEEESSSSSEDEKSPTPSALPDEVKLATDFPKDRVPFPSGARVTSSSSFGSGGNQTYIIELYTKDSPEDVATYFSDEMPKHGWSDSFESNSNGDFFVTFTAADTASTNEALVITAAESDTPGYTSVSVSVTVVES